MAIVARCDLCGDESSAQEYHDSGYHQRTLPQGWVRYSGKFNGLACCECNGRINEAREQAFSKVLAEIRSESVIGRAAQRTSGEMLT